MAKLKWCGTRNEWWTASSLLYISLFRRPQKQIAEIPGIIEAYCRPITRSIRVEIIIRSESRAFRSKICVFTGVSPTRLDLIDHLVSFLAYINGSAPQLLGYSIVVGQNRARYLDFSRPNYLCDIDVRERTIFAQKILVACIHRRTVRSEGIRNYGANSIQLASENI